VRSSNAGAFGEAPGVHDLVDRPNPLGLHRVRVLAFEGNAVEVDGLEAVDGTPVVDLKPLLGPVDER
jgi:tRNA (Thr-GGU) A37 N-methylase